MRDRYSRGAQGSGTVVQRAVSVPCPGKRTWTEQLPVQRAAQPGGAPATGDIHEIASRGTQGAGTSLPYLDQIQTSFGSRHDVSGIRAHVGGPATEAADRMGALAYATGNQVAFGAQPSLHTAAHEAAHVVQQRAGVQLKSGVGEVGDAYERNADEVADRVVAGRSAEDLLPAPGGGGGSAVQHQAVQLYTKIAGQPYDRLSDDGKLGVADHDKFGWAETGMIASSNAVLDTHHSKVKIEALGSGDVTVAPPGAKAGAATTTLKKFHIIDRVTKSEVELTDDCGAATQQVLGSEHYGSEEFVAASKNGTTQEFTGKEGYHADDNAAGGTVSTTEVLSGQIYVRIFEREKGKKLSREDALKAWAKLDPAEQKRLSQKYGINQYAVPKVGQSVTIGSERDMPGATPGGYNFHFAFNLMMSGGDYMTLEDYDSSGVKYYLSMYGPESKGQSFAEDPGNTGALGNKTTTMVVDHPSSLEGTINDGSAQLVDDPEKWDNSRVLAKGDKITIMRKGNNWMKVTVGGGKQAGQVGWILNKYFTQS
jgi:hypothetical protein